MTSVSGSIISSTNFVSLPKASFMSSNALPPSPGQCLVVGFGGSRLDCLAVLSNFPKPDEETICRKMIVQGGGDAANALICLARLGLGTRIVSKIVDANHGKSLLEELRAEGVDTSFLMVASKGQMPFSIIIVDQSTGTQTCVSEVMELAEDVPGLNSALEGASFIYFDAALATNAISVAREANRLNIPILLHAKTTEQGLEDFLGSSDYVICSAKFLQDFSVQEAWTEAPSRPCALISMLLRFQRLKFAIVTLGENGCLMLERSSEENPLIGEEDADSLLHSLKQIKDDSVARPICIPSEVVRLTANGIRKLTGRLSMCTAERIPSSELIDTTGAGDAFTGAILYALNLNWPRKEMLEFASTVAGAVCKKLGARTGLPCWTNPCLSPFLGQTGDAAISNI